MPGKWVSANRWVGWWLLLLLLASVLSACTRSAKVDEWALTGTFEIPVRAADGMQFTYPIRGEQGRFGFIDSPFVAGQGQKYMWHFWGERQEFTGKQLEVVAANQKGESLTLFTGTLGGPQNGAAAHIPSTMSLPTPGLWRLRVSVGEKLIGHIVVEAVVAPERPVACSETPAQERWTEDYAPARGQQAIWLVDGGGTHRTGDLRKVAWRVVGAAQKLVVKARRIDGPGSFALEVTERVSPNGRNYYPTYWDSVSYLTFPTAGCWELDLSAGEAQERITLLVNGGTFDQVTTAAGFTFPDGCSAERVSEILSGFMDTLSRGEMTVVLSYFGEGFQWYSAPAGGATEPKMETIDRLSELGAYFADRISHQERMRLQKLHITGRDHLGGVDFALNLHRTADDLKWGAGDVGGKGAVHCESGTILVWSLGTAAPLK